MSTSVAQTAQQGAAPTVLRVEGLVKSFQGQRAVDGLGFEVRQGECFGLLGPNGAGKSTTLRLVLGLADPDEGLIDLLGLRVPDHARVARMRVGVVPQTDALDPDFTVAENLLVFGRYFGLRDAQLRPRLDPLLDFAGLAHKRDARINELSGGMRRRLVLARALINDPQILFLDEPTTGLDPQARHLIWERLRQLLARGKTIVITTHFMDEAERLCGRLAVVDHGRLIAQDSPEALVRAHIEPHVVEVTGGEPGPCAQALRALPSTVRIEEVGETVFAYCVDPQPIIDAVDAMPGLRYLSRRANLEDVFLKLTGRELRD